MHEPLCISSEFLRLFLSIFCILFYMVDYSSSLVELDRSTESIKYLCLFMICFSLIFILIVFQGCFASFCVISDSC